MPVVSEEHRTAMRSRIIEAAIDAFHSKGFQQASMSDIIAASGLSAGALYGYFPSKQELTKAVAQHLISGGIETIDELAATDPVPPPAQLVRALGAMVVQRINPALLLQIWAAAGSDPDLQVMAQAKLGDLDAALTRYALVWCRTGRGMHPRSAKKAAGQLAPVLIGLVHGFLVRITVVPDFDVETYFAGIDVLVENA